MSYIDLSDIIIDRKLQARAHTNPDAIADLADAYKGANPPPPVRCVRTPDGDAILYDGFHRCQAANVAGLTRIQCEVTDGSKQDAIWLACAANREHDTAGQRRSNEDKRRAVALALESFPDRSDRSIAEHVGVHNSTVSRHRPQVSQSDTSTRTGQDGKQYPATKPSPPADVHPSGNSEPARGGRKGEKDVDAGGDVAVPSASVRGEQSPPPFFSEKPRKNGAAVGTDAQLKKCEELLGKTARAYQAAGLFDVCKPQFEALYDMLEGKA